MFPGPLTYRRVNVMPLQVAPRGRSPKLRNMVLTRWCRNGIPWPPTPTRLRLVIKTWLSAGPMLWPSADSSAAPFELERLIRKMNLFGQTLTPTLLSVGPPGRVGQTPAIRLTRTMGLILVRPVTPPWSVRGLTGVNIDAKLGPPSVPLRSVILVVRLSLIIGVVGRAGLGTVVKRLDRVGRGIGAVGVTGLGTLVTAGRGVVVLVRGRLM